jgi:integrase
MSQAPSFRVGKVSGYRRGQVWYLCYHENGRRRRPRVGPDKAAARQLAAQINGQLETGAPAALSFEPVTLPELRARWLDHHEQVLRSSLQSINRYRTATEHLFRFLITTPLKTAAQFQTHHAEAFVRYLRTVSVSPNGHPNTPKRPLLDKGVHFVLECCRAMFNFAAKRRHLPPYAENPFTILEIDRIPIETARRVELLNDDQLHAFLQACDDWQFPLFLTLLLTGLRPGELCHLLLPDDLDFESGLIRVRNKPRLGWQVKTRNQRDVPILPELVTILRGRMDGRGTGPVFLRRVRGPRHQLQNLTTPQLERELEFRIAAWAGANGGTCPRAILGKLARRIWHEAGALSEDRVRIEFIRVCQSIRMELQSAPKVFRHQFATILQEGRVDPLVRNLLMGHTSPDQRSAGHGLGMTAVYTHTRFETIRDQLREAFRARPWVGSIRLRIGN